MERDGRDLRDAILAATRKLLADHRFDEISVADILVAANVSRGSFYFYFESKQDVLVELVRRAVSQGHAAARPWLRHHDADERRAAIRSSIMDGAKLWRDEAPVLRAIVENWRCDPKLSALWREQMEGFTTATAERINADREAGSVWSSPRDVQALASALTWLGERLYYLAAVGVAPFDDENALVDVLTHIWMSTLYPPDQP